MSHPMSGTTDRVTLCLLVAAGLSAGCLPSSFVEPRITTRSRTAGPEGDPDRGREVLLNRTFTRYGLPLKVLRAASSSLPTREPAPRLAGRRGMNRFLPVGATALRIHGVPLVNANCFTCHSGMVDGKLYPGIGDSFTDATIDLRSSPLMNGTLASKLNLNPKEAEEFQRWQKIMSELMQYSVTTSPGTSPAVSFTSYLLAHRAPETYEWVEKPFVPVPTEMVETDIPAWYGVKKKKSLYYGGEAVGNRIPHIMQFFSAPGNTLADLEASKEDFKDVLAFMNQLQPPPYPYVVDGGLVLQGEAIFNRECSSCHGTYGASWTFPEKVVPMWKIDTDPVRWNAARYPGATDHYNRLWHGSDGARMTETEGYLAPPLDGIWVTAPYLHNGSVPTLADLLEPEARRPRYFIRHPTSRSYDPARVGWKVEVLEHGKPGEPDLERRRKIYDTDMHGKKNTGHRFGVDLPGDQKQALLEYLKTL